MDGHTIVTDFLEALRSDAGCLVAAPETAMFIQLALGLKYKNVLHTDHIAFHASDFRDVGDSARAVAQSGLLDNDIDRRGDLGPDRQQRQLHTSHHDHGFDTGDGVARRVRMGGRQ